MTAPLSPRWDFKSVQPRPNFILFNLPTGGILCVCCGSLHKNRTSLFLIQESMKCGSSNLLEVAEAAGIQFVCRARLHTLLTNPHTGNHDAVWCHVNCGFILAFRIILASMCALKDLHHSKSFSLFLCIFFVFFLYNLPLLQIPKIHIPLCTVHSWGAFPSIVNNKANAKIAKSGLFAREGQRNCIRTPTCWWFYHKCFFTVGWLTRKREYSCSSCACKHCSQFINIIRGDVWDPVNGWSTCDPCQRRRCKRSLSAGRVKPDGSGRCVIEHP